MSNIDRVPDDLMAKMGGKEPFFYAFCQTYWASLGNLASESVDPRVQLADNPRGLPVVDSYLVAQRTTPLPGGNESEYASTYISMASWIQKTVKWGFPDREQRYLVTKVEKLLLSQHKDVSLTTQYLIGRSSTLRSVLDSEDTDDAFTSSRGIETAEADLLVDEMSGPMHQETISMVSSLRDKATDRKELIAGNLPCWTDIKKGKVNSFNHVLIDGVPVENMAIQVSNLAKLLQSKLPITHSIELINNKAKIAAAATSLLLLPYR